MANDPTTDELQRIHTSKPLPDASLHYNGRDPATGSSIPVIFGLPDPGGTMRVIVDGKAADIDHFMWFRLHFALTATLSYNGPGSGAAG